jgi:hypothetical protein
MFLLFKAEWYSIIWIKHICLPIYQLTILGLPLLLAIAMNIGVQTSLWKPVLVFLVLYPEVESLSQIMSYSILCSIPEMGWFIMNRNLLTPRSESWKVQDQEFTSRRVFVLYHDVWESWRQKSWERENKRWTQCHHSEHIPVVMTSHSPCLGIQLPWQQNFKPSLGESH